MTSIDFTHAADLKCWVPSADGHSEFPVQNLPLGVFSPAGDDSPRGGVAIGRSILDLGAVADLLTGDARNAAQVGGAPSLNGLFALGHDAMVALRQALSRLLTDPAQQAAVTPHLYLAADADLYLPFAIGDYTDFYTGIRHAENVGRLLRPDNPLMPNYKYVPIGYHGRASSIRLSGTDVRRPRGQIKPPEATEPSVQPSARVDYELEMAIWVGQANPLGQPVPISDAGDHIGGLSLLNDWSARDIQAWEYQPLGPFLAKNFQSTISPWVVTTEALTPFRIAQSERPAGDPAPLPYLLDEGDQALGAFAIVMEVFVQSARMKEMGLPPLKLSSGSMANMYWTPAQLIAHHTSNGCNLVPGDLLGTGTLSGDTSSSFGSLMEITRGGKEPLTLPSGETRTFLEDGDELSIAAYAERDGFARIGFGPCTAKILSAAGQ